MSEGKKYDKGKPDWSMLPPKALEEIVKVYDFGATKYARDNWKKGLEWSRVFAAIQRHLWAFWQGENIDKESGLSHLSHAGWGILALLTYVNEKPELDNRIQKDKVSFGPVEIKFPVTFSGFDHYKQGTDPTDDDVKEWQGGV